MKSLVTLIAALVVTTGQVDAQTLNCSQDRFVHGSWVDPGIHPGVFQAGLLDEAGALQYVLDAELTRYMLQTTGSGSGAEMGGIYGRLQSVAPPVDAELYVRGEWSQSPSGQRDYSAFIIMEGEGVVGTLSGSFGASESSTDRDEVLSEGTLEPDVLGGSSTTPGVNVSASRHLGDASTRDAVLASLPADRDSADAGTGHSDGGGRATNAQGVLDDLVQGFDDASVSSNDASGSSVSSATRHSGRSDAASASQAAYVQGADMRAASSGDDGRLDGSDASGVLSEGTLDRDTHTGASSSPSASNTRVDARRFDGSNADADGGALDHGHGTLVGSWGMCSTSD